jgi:hypothetical protein
MWKQFGSRSYYMNLVSSNYTHNFFSNNQSANALNINPKYHSCSKHVGTWYHFTKDKLLENHTTLCNVPTFDMIVIIFMTKFLPLKEIHFHCFKKLGMCVIPHNKPSLFEPPLISQ